MKDFKDKIVWIVGSSSGIGAALAKKLASEGAIIALSSRSESKLKEVKKSLTTKGHKIYPLDVTDTDKVGKIAIKVKKDFNRIDSVIFMAASYSPNNGYEKDINLVKQIVDVNFNGALNLVHSTLPILKKQKEGQIAICASVAGYRGLPGGQPYCATKAALINFTESLCIENKKHGIDIKVINPGFVETPLTDKNKFEMPCIIKAEEAAERISKGLKSNSFEIHFPKRFTYFLKFLQILPNWLYLKIMRQVAKKM